MSREALRAQFLALPPEEQDRLIDEFIQYQWKQAEARRKKNPPRKQSAWDLIRSPAPMKRVICDLCKEIEEGG